MTPIKNPIEWSRLYAGTKLKLGIFLIFHFFIGLYAIFDSSGKNLIPIMLIGIIFPSLYLYCLYNCLQTIDKKPLLRIHKKYLYIGAISLGFIFVFYPLFYNDFEFKDKLDILMVFFRALSVVVVLILIFHKPPVIKFDERETNEKKI